jgi:hypothetical protein
MVVLLVIISIVFARVMKLRKDIGTKRTRKKVDSEFYPFESRSKQQELLIETYKELLEQLEERGLKRPSSMTVDEFRDVIIENMGKVRGLKDLTLLFDEARYSDHNISSHLIGTARGHRSSIIKDLEDADIEDLKKKVKRSIQSYGEEVERPIIWKMNIDHASDLKDLLGKKEVKR